MGDADDSYDFSALDGFVAKLREGYALVVGNRFRGGIRPGAMPFLNRYLGNPVLSFIGALLLTSIADFHCGLRGFDRRTILDLGLVMPGMEFASEMVVKAAMRGLKRRGAHRTASRRARTAAASQALARWLAASEVPADAQPALALSLSGAGDGHRRTRRHDAAGGAGLHPDIRHRASGP